MENLKIVNVEDSTFSVPDGNGTECSRELLKHVNESMIIPISDMTDEEIINPFIESITEILPQLGFESIIQKGVSYKPKKIIASGIVLMLGIVGDKKGNVVYSIGKEDAKKIASIMMMGMPVDELDDMAKSALSELSNMLTANASINFSNESIAVDISPPTLLYGEDMELSMSKDMVLCVEFDIDGIKLEINVALD